MALRFSSFSSSLFSLFSLFVLLFLGACNNQVEEKIKKEKGWYGENQKLKILTTIAMIEDIVHEIAQDKADTISLICGELDPHTYELVKGDDEKFSRADLIFYNGLGLEHGWSLRQHLEKNEKAIALGDCIFKKEPSLVLFENGQIDPHIWMDISLWAHIIEPIVENLSLRDPSNASFYRERGLELQKKMEMADRKAYERLQLIPPEKRYLITSHDAFQYFTRRYLSTSEELTSDKWKERSSAPEGLAPDAEISVHDITCIVNHIKKYNIQVVFPESNMNKDSLKKIVSASREFGIKLRLSTQELYADAMGRARDYLQMVSHNVEVIASELDK